MPIGTPFFDAFLARLQEWVDDLDLTPEMLESWVYMAEERFNNELRVLEMVQLIAAVMFADQCIPFPEDWLEIISCHCTNNGQPLRYVSSDEFFRLRAASEYHPAAAGSSSSTGITYLDPVTGAQVNPPSQQPAYIDYYRQPRLNMPLLQNAYTYLGKTLYIHPTIATPSVDVDPTEVRVVLLRDAAAARRGRGADTALSAGAEALHLRGAVDVGAVSRRGSARDDLGRQRHGADQEHERERPDGADRLFADPHAGKDVRVMADSLYGLEIYSEDLYSSGEVERLSLHATPRVGFLSGAFVTMVRTVETRVGRVQLFYEVTVCTSKHTTEG